MRHRPAIVLLSALGLTSGLAAIASATKPTSSQSIRTTLTQIRETRVYNAKPTGADDFVFPHEKPGLFLAFDLDVPPGLTLIDLSQPSRIRAVDSVGSDLTVINESFMGVKEHVSLDQFFGESPTSFTMTLAAPVRSATRFSIEASMLATLFATTSTHTMPASTDWVELPVDATDGAEVRVKIDTAGGSANLHVQPGTARDIFEEITLKGPNGEFVTMGSMWSDDDATFFFDGQFQQGMTITFTIRTGLTTVPVNVSIADMALP